jgi:hypothetical protein
VIARMEYENAQGISMFYTYFKQNLVAVISTKRNIFSISCWPVSEPFIGHVNFNLKFESPGLCGLVKTQYTVYAGNLNLMNFYDNKRYPQIFITKRDEFLVFWGCVEIEDMTHDLAAWILFSNNSMRFGENDMKTQLQKFLKNLNEEVKLNISEGDFRLNEVKVNETTCDTNPKKVYKKIKKDVEEMKNGNSNLQAKSSEFKLTFTFTFFMMLMIVIGIFFIISIFLGKQFCVSNFKVSFTMLKNFLNI